MSTKSIEKNAIANQVRAEREVSRVSVVADFSESLKRLLKKHRWTIYDLEVESGIYHSALRKYVNGERLPGLHTLVRMKNTFRCSWDELLGSK